MSYRALDDTSVLTYVREVEALGPFCGADANLCAKEVGDGNLNQVFIITNRTTGKSVILKQALPYLRVAGDNWPLTRERMKFETGALLFYGDVVADLVPEVLHHDEAMSLIVMEFLGDLEVMRKLVIKGQRFEHFAEQIGRFMASTHFYTTDAYLSSSEKKARLKTFLNPQLCKLQEDFVFTNPFMDSPENSCNPLLASDVAALRQDTVLKLAIATAKAEYMTHAQALLHGDLHTGSIMVNREELKVIDPEFAFFGPQGYDVGTLFANLVLGALSHVHHTADPERRASYQHHLLDLIPGIWRVYTHTFDVLWQEHNEGDLTPPAFWDFSGGKEAFAVYRRAYLNRVLGSAARLGGCELLRRLMGIVSVAELTQIDDEGVRVVAEQQAIQIARAWLTETITDGASLAGAAKSVVGLTKDGVA